MSKRRPPRLTAVQVAALTPGQRQDYCLAYVKWRTSQICRLIGMDAKLRRRMWDGSGMERMCATVEAMLLKGSAHGHFDDMLREGQVRRRGFDPLMPPGGIAWIDFSPPKSAEFVAALLVKAESRECQLGDRAEQFEFDVLRFGRGRAELLYWWDIVMSVAPFLWAILRRIGLIAILADLFRRFRGFW
jgi:hypothetical protein